MDGPYDGSSAQQLSPGAFDAQAAAAGGYPAYSQAANPSQAAYNSAYNPGSFQSAASSSYPSQQAAYPYHASRIDPSSQQAAYPYHASRTDPSSQQAAYPYHASRIDPSSQQAAYPYQASRIDPSSQQAAYPYPASRIDPSSQQAAATAYNPAYHPSFNSFRGSSAYPSPGNNGYPAGGGFAVPRSSGFQGPGSQDQQYAMQGASQPYVASGMQVERALP